jgi:hypothetical protein
VKTRPTHADAAESANVATLHNQKSLFLLKNMTLTFWDFKAEAAAIINVRPFPFCLIGFANTFVGFLLGQAGVFMYDNTCLKECTSTHNS